MICYTYMNLDYDVRNHAMNIYAWEIQWEIKFKYFNMDSFVGLLSDLYRRVSLFSAEYQTGLVSANNIWVPWRAH